MARSTQATQMMFKSVKIDQTARKKSSETVGAAKSRQCPTVHTRPNIRSRHRAKRREATSPSTAHTMDMPSIMFPVCSATAPMGGTVNCTAPPLETLTLGHNALSSDWITSQYVPSGNVNFSVALHVADSCRFSATHAPLPRQKAIVSPPGAWKFVTWSLPADLRQATMFAIAGHRCSHTQGPANGAVPFTFVVRSMLG